MDVARPDVRVTHKIPPRWRSWRRSRAHLCSRDLLLGEQGVPISRQNCGLRVSPLAAKQRRAAGLGCHQSSVRELLGDTDVINRGQRGSSTGPSITTAGDLDSERGPLSDARHANGSGDVSRCGETYHSPWKSSFKKEPREQTPPFFALLWTEERKVGKKSGFQIPPRETVRGLFRTEQVD